MSDDADLYWDDEPQGQPASDEPPDYADDEFAVWTFETGALEAVPPARRAAGPAAGPPVAPALPLRRPAASLPARARGGTASVWLSILRNTVIVGAAAILVSTIFSLWTRPNFFSDEFRAGLNKVQATQRVIAIQPSPLPTDAHQIRIGVIAGHSGRPQDPAFESDPGAVCPDGLTELSINEAVARQVVTMLSQERYMVDLLAEFDPRLTNYQADALISIHTNDCQDYGEGGTGFNAASAAARQTTRGRDEKLLACLLSQYGATTGLPRHFGLTYDMTSYHTFSEVAIDTPVAIIELGFMRNDRVVLTERQDAIAQGIVNGIRCFLLPDGAGTPPAGS
jgi:N-acetylmuramoyl-L-alanine amidase